MTTATNFGTFLGRLSILGLTDLDGKTIGAALDVPFGRPGKVGVGNPGWDGGDGRPVDQVRAGGQGKTGRGGRPGVDGVGSANVIAACYASARGGNGPGSNTRRGY